MSEIAEFISSREDINFFAGDSHEAKVRLEIEPQFRQVVAESYDKYLSAKEIEPDIDEYAMKYWQYRFIKDMGPQVKDNAIRKIVKTQTTKENMEAYIRSFKPLQRYKPWLASKTTMILTIAFLVKNNPDVCVVFQDKSCIDEGRCDMVWDDINVRLLTGNIFDNNFTKCLQKQNKKIIVIPLILQGKGWAHSNFIIIRKTTNHKPIAQHFEPHGNINAANNDEKMKQILGDYFDKFGILYAHNSVMCPYGLQEIECVYKDRRCKDVRNDPGGYCAAWSFFFLQTALQFPDLWSSDITQLVAEALKKDPKQFHKFIVNYSQFLYKNIDLLVLDKKVRQIGVSPKPQKRTVKGLRPSTLSKTRSSLVKERMKERRKARLYKPNYEKLLAREFIESQSK